MTHLYLIRHGEYTDGLQGGKTTDLGLSTEGIRQVESLRDRLIRTGEINAEVLISSPERRAHETAQLLAPIWGLPIILDKDVEEWRTDDGSISNDDFMARWQGLSDAQKAYYRWIPGYENRMEFVLRVHLVLNRILEEHEGKTIVLVSHGAFIQTSFLYFFGYGEASLRFASPEVKHTSLMHWHNSDKKDKWSLERSNDYHHLRDIK
jgi:probable phosphoglycerate mutase